MARMTKKVTITATRFSINAFLPNLSPSSRSPLFDISFDYNERKKH